MSEIDPDEQPEPRWFHSESELPGISSVDPSIELGVNMSFPSAEHIQEVRALIIGNSSATGPATNTGILVGNGPQEGAECSKGDNFLDTPTHTPAQSKSPSPIPFHRGWSMDRGRGVGRQGAKVLHYTGTHHINIAFL